VTVAALRGALLGTAVVWAIGCGRTMPLELDDVGSAMPGGADNGGAGSGASDGAAAHSSAGVAGKGSGAVGEGACDGGPVWSCAASVVSGCCDGESNGAFGTPACGEVCDVLDDPSGSPCGTPGQTMIVPLTTGLSKQCQGYWDCYKSTCTCGCTGVPGLSSSCEPQAFTNALTFPEGVALQDQFVYWTVYSIDCPTGSLGGEGFGFIMGARRDDGTRTVRLAHVPCPLAVAAADDDLYWTNTPGFLSSSVWTAKNTGQGAHALATGLRSPSTIRVDAQSVYWNDFDGIYAISRHQSATPQRVVAVDQIDSAKFSAFVIDDHYIYWTDQAPYGKGGVFRVEKSGGSPEQLVAVEHAMAIALSSAGLFWLEETSFQEFAVSFYDWNTRAAVQLTTITTQPFDLAAFGDQVYWAEIGANGGPGYVRFARVGQTGSVQIVGQQHPVAVAVDDKYVFWSDQALTSGDSTGAIDRACR
jgi:hypothetical protein